jgi:hypothetical protein
MMAVLRLKALAVLTLICVASAFPQFQPFKHVLQERQDAKKDPLTVDLGYGVYRGSTNASSGINTWRG